MIDKEDSSPKPFIFFNYWSKDENFLPLVEKASDHMRGSNLMLALYSLLKVVKLDLRKLGDIGKE